MRIFKTTSEAYLGIIREVLHSPENICSPRGMKVYEILDFQYRVLGPQLGPIVTRDEERNKVIADYTQKELEWYLSGNVKADSAPSAFWKKLANPDGTINSNYGFLVLHENSEGYMYESDHPFEVYRTPYEWAKQCLEKDKDSRQALIRVNKPWHSWHGNNDFVCTISVMAMIRDDKLHFSVVQRSCDGKTGLAYDLPWWIWLQHRMVEDLKETYPHLQVGHITHTIHSMHIYEKDLDVVKKMLGE
jgi:thymidylate synthase